MSVWLAVLVAAPVAIGCGGVTEVGEVDAGSGGEADAGSGGQPDGSAADAAPACAVAARYDVLTGDDANAVAGGAADTGLFVFVDLGGEDRFKVTFAPGFEPFLGADGLADPQDGSGTQDDLVVPGPIAIAGPQLTYATAGVAIEIFGNVAVETFEQGYYATGGSVQLDSVDGQLAFSLVEISFEHVVIDPDTLEQTPGPSGCTTSIGSAGVVVTIQNE
ncbi:MAG TPA: hypothetical protein VK698_20370 [Kofleriaceae bacterium]|nr:hypothetical protein [Kofleriaceae bacterium]